MSILSLAIVAALAMGAALIVLALHRLGHPRANEDLGSAGSDSPPER
jgi:hypothetical protein